MGDPSKAVDRRWFVINEIREIQKKLDSVRVDTLLVGELRDLLRDPRAEMRTNDFGAQFDHEDLLTRLRSLHERGGG